MKALVRNSTKPGEASIKELEVPKPTGVYMLAKVEYAGICASDLDILYNRNDIYKPPVVQGHEYSATVVEIGHDVEGFTVGDLVTSETTLDVQGVPDAHLQLDYQLMAGKRILGWTVNGGFAQYILLNSRFCHKFSNGTSPMVAALCEPTAVAAESVVIKGNIKSTDTVVVVGPGPIGMLCALMAKDHIKAKQVYLIGLPSDASRLETAKNMGLTDSYTTEDAVQDIIKDKNEGKLADVVIDATGHIKGFELSMELVKRNGRIVEAGSITEDTMFSWEKAAFLALDLCFVFSSSHRAWQIATDFLNTTSLDLKMLVSKTYGLDDYEEAFAQAGNTGENIKVLFKPNK